MSVKTDFLRLAGLPVPAELMVEAANPTFKDRNNLSLVKRALMTTIAAIAHKASTATTTNLKQVYHNELVDYDKILGLFVAGKHQAAVKEWNKLDQTAQDYVLDSTDLDASKDALAQYFQIPGAVEAPEQEDDQVIGDVGEPEQVPTPAEANNPPEDVYNKPATGPMAGESVVAEAEEIKVEPSTEQGLEDKEKEIEKKDDEQDNWEKVEVPSHVIKDLDDAMAELKDKLDNKYITHLPNIGPELNRYAETIEILQSMQKVFKSGCPHNIKTITVLLTSLDSALKLLVPASTWKFLSMEQHGKTMVATLSDLFKEIKLKK